MSKTANVVRNAILYLPNMVKHVTISNKDRALYFEVSYEGAAGMKTAALARRAGISVKCAHNQLNKLAKKGYVRKVQGVHKSGGKEYTFIAIEL